MLNKIDGYKTYIGTAVVFIAGGLKAINAIDENVFQILATVGASIAAFGLRSAINKIK